MSKAPVSKPRPAAAWWRLLAAFVFAAVPTVSLPLFISHLFAVRPHVTDASAGFVLPHYREGVTWYFAHSDEMLIRGLSFWLLAAVILLLFVGGQMIRRRLKQWLKPPVTEVDNERLKPDDIGFARSESSPLRGEPDGRRWGSRRGEG